ncbi:serine hydrolase [Nocardia terpenica]|uniref:Uncharacterized protein n=1 Tax=Nocardia terpenica TaxID=455432 RepID=A0A291RNE5_9NOCA|nr:serine hydrolase [Nocardia terpenica]ATL69093.1 hypothetical protein CRH09_25880 [Nocardia terpenica]
MRISGRPTRARLAVRLAAAGALTIGTLLAPGAVASAAPPSATDQMHWFVGATARAPISESELAEHLSPSFLSAVGADGFNASLTHLGKLTEQRLADATPTGVQAFLGRDDQTDMASLAVDQSGRIMALGVAPVPNSWDELDTQLRRLAPDVGFAAAEIDPNGTCRMLHGVDPDTPRPLGSAFKLYVLGALGQAVADHRASWTDQLAVRDDWKSLPSGVLQNTPAGTELPLQEYANKMISISDNTAADHLIHFLGRDAVTAQLPRFGMAAPQRNDPFLTTRELFALKGYQYPAGASAYLAAPQPLRAAALPALDLVPRDRITAWTAPEDIDRIEWFASPADICRAYAGLWQQNSQPGGGGIGTALSINDGGVALPSDRYPTVWFKGGSEPGVLTFNNLARSASGKLLVSSVMLSDTGKELPGLDTLSAVAVAHAALQLADR